MGNRYVTIKKERYANSSGQNLRYRRKASLSIRSKNTPHALRTGDGKGKIISHQKTGDSGGGKNELPNTKKKTSWAGQNGS